MINAIKGPAGLSCCDTALKLHSIKRMLLTFMGMVFVCLGILGIVLPVLPTTPFMIIALWCFAQSSERFHKWLYEHSVFGPPLQQWDRHRVIPPIAKAIAVIAMIASTIYVTTYSGVPYYMEIAMGILFIYAAWYILSKPSRVIE